MSGILAQLVDDSGDLSSKVQVVAVIVTVVMLAFVLELVRRRRLVERYALLWIVVALALVVLAVWRGGLNFFGELIGVADPVNGIFLIAFGAVFALLLNFSVAISRLSEETKILAQTVSRLDAELRALRSGRPGRNGTGSAADSPGDQAGEAPVAGEESGEQA
jgi:hypothetical protein